MVVVSIPVMQANSAAELSIVRALHPPPAAISWLVTLAFWLGSAGVAVLLVVVALLVPRLTAVRWIAVAAALTWGVCIVLGAVLGPTAGRPPVSELAGLNAAYPVTQLAVAIAVAATALPYLSRPMHRLVSFLVAVAALAAVCGGEALPVNAVSSIALGWGVAAGLHLAVGSPLGLPSAAEVADWIADLNVAVRDITRVPRQVWGVEQFTGRDGKYVPLQETIRGFAEILDGKHDDIPEDAFLLAGSIDEVVERAKEIAGQDRSESAKAQASEETKEQPKADAGEEKSE